MPRYLSEDGLPTSKTRSASYLMRRFACPLRCRMRDGGSNCRSEPSVLRLSHGLSTMRGGGGGGRRDPRGCCDLQPVSFVLPIAASPVRRADDSSRDIYRHVVDGLSSTLRCPINAELLKFNDGRRNARQRTDLSPGLDNSTATRQLLDSYSTATRQLLKATRQDSSTDLRQARQLDSYSTAPS